MSDEFKPAWPGYTEEDDRSPYDGKPFYCILCGLGFGEYAACELPDCQLESETAAQTRKTLHDEVQSDSKS